jgi:ribonucleoside-diphosphate reductase alpha chain
MVKNPRPDIVQGTTRRIETGCGNIYVTINCDEAGKPFEVFAQIGKTGGCAASQTEALGRLVALSLRNGASIPMVIKQLRGVRCLSVSKSLDGEREVLSCADAIGQAFQMWWDDAKQKEKEGK